MSRVGVLCNPDHEVLSEVSDLLEDETEAEVVFLDPEERLPDSELVKYDLLVPKKSRVPVYQNMRAAESKGVDTLNGFLTSMTADHNLASIRHLEAKGFNVPSPILDPDPDRGETEYVIEKPIHECLGEEPMKLNGGVGRGEGYLIEEFLSSDGTDYKLYIIDCDETYVGGAKTSSKLLPGNGDRQSFDFSEIDFSKGDAEEVLKTFYEADFLGVDIIVSEGTPFIVDVNSAPSFRGIDKAPEKLADAIYARL